MMYSLHLFLQTVELQEEVSSPLCWLVEDPVAVCSLAPAWLVGFMHRLHVMSDGNFDILREQVRQSGTN